MEIRHCVFCVQCLVLHTACCSQWCIRKLPTQLAHQGTAWDYYYYIWTLCSHLLCDCMFVCVCLRVWTWVGGHKCELAGTLCVGGWKTSITTKSVQYITDLVIPAKEVCIYIPYFNLKLCECQHPYSQGYSTPSQSSWMKPCSSQLLSCIKVWRRNPYSQLQPSVFSIKAHFSVLQQHRGQQRLDLALIVALSYLPVCFSFALSP